MKTYCEWCEHVEVEESVSLCSDECESEQEQHRREVAADILHDRMKEGE